MPLPKDQFLGNQIKSKEEQVDETKTTSENTLWSFEEELYRINDKTGPEYKGPLGENETESSSKEEELQRPLPGDDCEKYLARANLD